MRVLGSRHRCSVAERCRHHDCHAGGRDEVSVCVWEVWQMSLEFVVGSERKFDQRVKMPRGPGPHVAVWLGLSGDASMTG